MGFIQSIRAKILTVLLLGFAFCLNAAPSAANGKTLFQANCGSCHAKNMKTAMTGPALGGVEARWDSKASLYGWIRNSQGMVKKGNARAVEIFNQYNKSVMTAFPNLTDDEIGSILLYIEEAANPPAKGPVVNGPGLPEQSKSNSWFYFGIFGLLALLALGLASVISNLNKMSAAKDGMAFSDKTLWQKLTSKGMVSFLIFAGVILGGYTTVTRAVNLGRQQGYEPDQPIKFSHVTHAGLNKIDCQYCHDGARRSKHSVIPAANTCMNCHKAIKTGSKYGTAEITKIFASIGFDPNKNRYVPNYDNLSQDSVKAIYAKWIGDQYKASTGLASLDDNGRNLISDQWKNIVASLTSNLDNKVQGSIEWVRIHNLPDHAYFNHAQHVSIGKIACQTCHGDVEKMEVVKQHAPLSMGWCVNCHRETEVKFKDNAYYASYASLHEELKSGKRDKVTVADIGGLECQKCHY
jgi:mono/diheme cytochrome c family protein